MAQFEVRRDRQLVGSLDTDDAEWILDIQGKPFRRGELARTTTFQNNYQLYKTGDGCIVSVTEHCSRDLGPAELISISEAIELCKRHNVERPHFLTAETQPPKGPPLFGSNKASR